MMKKLLIVVFAVLFFITGCGNTNTEVDTMINVEEVNKIIDNYESEENVYIVDVREKSEFAEGHLLYAINVPLSIIDTIEDINVIDKDAKIIVCCRSGNRSKEAQSRLKKLGYADVYDMGGILDWPYEIVK